MPKPKVLVTRVPPGSALERLREECEVWMWEEDTAMPRDLLLEKVRDAEGLHCIFLDGVNEELLAAAPRLRAVSTYAAGMENIDLGACTTRGIPVGYTPGAVTEATADIAFGLMLAASRRLMEASRYVTAGKWRDWSPTTMIANDVFRKTLGIVGMGRIGQAVARRARGFEMTILYHNRKPDPEAERKLGASYRSLADLLAESDIVVLAPPLTPETRHMINDEALARMKPASYLINVGRGPIVDSAALFRALSEGKIRGAALDVTEPEPIPPDHPLLTLDNCLIIPHIGTATWETRSLMTEISVSNLLRMLGGEPPLHCANPEVFP